MLCNNCMRDKGVKTVCPYCGYENVPDNFPHHLPPGTVIGGRYTLGRVLGEGGFGITYVGFDHVLELRVAVKEYFPKSYTYRSISAGLSLSISGNKFAIDFEEGKQKFLSEAKTVARFRAEPGIVDVSDFIEENNTAYIVMEYLDGINLRDFLERYGVMSPDYAVSLFMPVMKSLDKIHAAGIIHRDISPDNLMYLKNGSVKLMDFGAARDFLTNNYDMSVVLKHGYAPEEQYHRNSNQGPWTDVYALCATIYRCITGTTPPDSLDRTGQDNILPPSQLGVQIYPETENILMYGLAVYSRDRCQSMAELYRLFQQTTGYDPSAYANTASPTADGNEYTGTAPQKPRKKGKKAAVIVACSAAALLLIIILAAVIGVSGRKNTVPSAAPPVTPPANTPVPTTAVSRENAAENQLTVTEDGSQEQNVGQGDYVGIFDDGADLMTATEKQALSSLLSEISQECGCNIVFFTANDLSGAAFTHKGTAQDFTKRYYETRCGVNTDGVVVSLILSDEDGDAVISLYTSGNCEDRLTNQENTAIRTKALRDHHPYEKTYYNFLSAIADEVKEAILNEL